MPIQFRPVRGPAPRSPSVADAFRHLGQHIQEMQALRELTADRKKADEEEKTRKQIEAENRLLELAPVLSMFEPAQPTPMGETAPPAAPPTAAAGRGATGGGPPKSILPTMPEGVPTAVPLGGRTLAKPLLTEITLPNGQKIPIPPVRGERERLQAEDQAALMRELEAERFKREKGTEILTQEAWEQLPKFWQARWSPGQRISSDEIGTIGAEVVKGANKKVGIEKSVDLGDRVLIQYSDGRTEERRKGKLATAGDEEKYVWATDSSGRRVRITEKELNAATPGTYSDIRPPAAKGAGASAATADQARKILGTPEGEDPNSVWSLAMKYTLPGPAWLSSPIARGLGMATSVSKAGGGSPEIDLYESQVEGFAPLFARMVGHQGRLSDKDLERTTRLFPVLSGPRTDSQEVAKRKLLNIEKMMSGEKPVPAGLFDPQPGVWPPPNEDLTEDELSLLDDYGLGEEE